MARELINRIQNLRKDSGFDVTDKIKISISSNEKTDQAISHFSDYICQQTLAVEVKTVAGLTGTEVDIDDDLKLVIAVSRV